MNFSFFFFYFSLIFQFHSKPFKILNDSALNPNVVQVCMATNRLSTLKHLTNGLEECQKLLNGYLDAKRHMFPRYVVCMVFRIGYEIRTRNHFKMEFSIISTKIINCFFILCTSFFFLFYFSFLIFSFHSFRFYFISTDELLSVLGSGDSISIQKHVIKVRNAFLESEKLKLIFLFRFFFFLFSV